MPLDCAPGRGGIPASKMTSLRSRSTCILEGLRFQKVLRVITRNTFWNQKVLRVVTRNTFWIQIKVLRVVTLNTFWNQKVLRVVTLNTFGPKKLAYSVHDHLPVQVLT